MIKAIIISGILFVFGNALWWVFDEQKILYVPQAIFFILLLTYVINRCNKQIERIFLEYLILLAYGNLIKQIFYTDTLKQINDYVWGGIVTIHLIYKLIKWATTTSQRSGRKFYKAQENF